MQDKNVIVLGAGITGLIIARKLHLLGYQVKVLDKGRGVGGRMSTRRFGGGRVDHGAQFFTVRGKNMQSVIDDPIFKDIVHVWSRGFASNTKPFSEDGYPRYVASNGMSAIPKALASGLDVQTSVRIESIQRADDIWILTSDEGEKFQSSLLIVTCPAEQTLNILNNGNVVLNENERRILEAVKYNPSIAVMVRISGTSKIPAPGGLRFESGPISWMADNTQKGLKTQNPEESLITIHSDHQFAQKHWEEDLDATAQKLIKSAEPWIGDSILEYKPHRWRYALSLQSVEPGYLELKGSPKCFIAGDGFGGGKVEGAVESAFATIQAITSSPS